MQMNIKWKLIVFLYTKRKFELCMGMTSGHVIYWHYFVYVLCCNAIYFEELCVYKHYYTVPFN